jgi:hypothetical protein
MYKCVQLWPAETDKQSRKRRARSVSSQSRSRRTDGRIDEMPKLDEQISTLQERLKQLKLRQQRSEARKRALDAQRERKAETRRRFVVGEVVLAKVEQGEMDRGQLRAWLDQALTRQDDRALFDLPPKQH